MKRRHAAPASRHRPSHPPHEPLPVDQLKQVKRATSRYRDIRNAIADGYADIGLVLPNMGRHFMKNGLLDSGFEVEHRRRARNAAESG